MPGLTVMLLSVWLTVTLTLLVAVSPPGSVIVTRKRIAPRRAERGRGVLARIGAVGAEDRRGRGRRARRGPSVRQTRLGPCPRPLPAPRGWSSCR